MNTSLSHKYVDYKKVKKGIKQQPMETNMKHDQQNQGQTGDSGGEKLETVVGRRTVGMMVESSVIAAQVQSNGFNATVQTMKIQ